MTSSQETSQPTLRRTPEEIKEEAEAMKEQRTYFQGEIRATGDGLIHGKISYGTLSQDLGGFTEIVNHGAFDDSINSGKEIFALWGHDANQPLGSINPEWLIDAKR